MTRADLREQVTILGRVGSNVSTTLLNTWLYEAVKRLQDDVRWFAKKRIFYTREYFSYGTDEGFKVSIGTTAASTSKFIGLTTAQSNISGDTLAGYLETYMQSASAFNSTEVSLTFSTSDFKFTLGNNLATAMSVDHPNYSTAFSYSALHKLFGYESISSASSTSITGDVAPYCTSEYPLPDDFLSVKEVRYDDKGYPLAPEIYRDRDTGTGTPQNYYIRDSYLGITPQPTDGGKPIELDYYYIPSDFSADTDTHPFPEVYDFAIIHYACYLYKQSQEDTQGMFHHLGMYEEFKRKAASREQARVGGAINVFDRGQRRSRWDPRRLNLR